MFRFTLAMNFRSVGARGLPPGVGERVGTLLGKFYDGQPLVQAQVADRHGHDWT